MWIGPGGTRSGSLDVVYVDGDELKQPTSMTKNKWCQRLNIIYLDFISEYIIQIITRNLLPFLLPFRPLILNLINYGGFLNYTLFGHVT